MDRFIRLRIYDTSDTLKYDNQNDTSWGIEAGSMVLDGFIMDSELKFGELTSSMFSCKVFGINEDLRGYKILVSVGTDDGIETNLLTNDGDPILTNDGENITTVQIVDNRIFTGYIVSSRTDTSELYRDIEAYDLAYDLSTKDATAFWNSFWTTNANTTVTLADIRSALLTYFSISYVTPSTLVNDDLVITNTFEGITTVTLTFGTILASICELQNTCPHFNGSGQLEFYKLSANTYNVMSQIEKYNSEWEDYTTATITGVAIYDTSDNIVKRVGTAGNFYNISGNLFLLGRTAQELDTIGGNMLTELSLITYVPAKLKFIESQLGYRFGDKLVTDRGNTYIFSNRLSGSVLIEQTTSCNALGETLGDIPSDANDGLVNTHSMHEMINTVDELSSIITDPTTGIQSIVQQLSDKVVLKVQSDGTLALCELSADPSTGTTAFIVKAGNFSVDAQGNVTISGNLTSRDTFSLSNVGNLSGDRYTVDFITTSFEEAVDSSTGDIVLDRTYVRFKDSRDQEIYHYTWGRGDTGAGHQFRGDVTVVLGTLSAGCMSVSSGYLNVWENTTISKNLTVDGTIGGNAVYTRSSVGDIGWGTTANRTKLPTVNAISYWNGCYSGTSSNLQYCDRGRFGTIVTKATGDYVAASGGTFTGGVTFNTAPTIKSGINIGLNAYSAGSTTQTGALELYNGNYVLIDFHWKYSSDDWTFRITQHAADTLEFYGHNVSTWGTLKAKAFSVQSSIHVKENIEDITEEEASKLLQLRPVSFDYKNSETKNQRGLIAEEVLEIYPEMVEIPEGYTEFDPNDPSIAPSIDYSKFVPYLIKFTQMQDKKIKSLESRIEKLESIIEKFAIETIINNTTGGEVNE